jgi:hypothetical protein
MIRDIKYTDKDVYMLNRLDSRRQEGAV